MEVQDPDADVVKMVASFLRRLLDLDENLLAHKTSWPSWW